MNQNSSSGGSFDNSAGENPVLLELRYHPLMKSRAISAVVVGVVVLTSAISYYVIQNPLMPVLTFLFFIMSMASFFMPSRYIFTKENFVIDRIVFRKSFPWTRFRSYAVERNGVFISPSSNPERFDRFRGVFMVMDRACRDKLEPLLKEKLGGTQ
ncbi:MAG: hypothetical protein LWY06_00025 [Firmicutes bacterium]|nr:hypothetical protein [Bacillota bacterium]